VTGVALGKGGQKWKWRSVQAERRSTRIQNDRRTSLEKAKANRKKGGGLWRRTTLEVKMTNLLIFLPISRLWVLLKLWGWT
jgi:hypothetical protein